MTLPLHIRSRLGEKLRSELGAERIDESPDTLSEYAEDWTENPGRRPDFVVRAKSFEDVRRTIQIAREHRVAVIPIVGGLNLSGIALAHEDGVVLDLAGLDRILEVDAENQFMLLEPGVTWAQVSERLRRDFPRLRFAYPTAPPYTSVVANALMDGLVNLSTRHGTSGSWLNGVEAILADGRVVRTGSAAFGQPWTSASPLPDLTGLFRNFQGTTGIVTKAALQLWPRREIVRRYFVPAYETRPVSELAVRLAREDVFDDVSSLAWPLAKMVLGVEAPRERSPGEPAWFLYVEFSADRDRQIALAEEILREHLRRSIEETRAFEPPIAIEDLVRIEPGFRPFAELPAEMTFLTGRPGGLTWVGSYGPVSAWTEAIEDGQRVLAGQGFPPAAVTRPMKLAHFGTLLFPIVFDKTDRNEVERVRAANRGIAEAVVLRGFIPFKTPRWVVERFRDRIDPGFLSVLSDVKRVLDPDRILNPGNWLL